MENFSVLSHFEKRDCKQNAVFAYNRVFSNIPTAVLAFAQKIHRLVDFLARGSLVDAYVADAAQQREIDGAGGVLLVVSHQVEQLGVVVASDAKRAVILADERGSLS